MFFLFTATLKLIRSFGGESVYLCDLTKLETPFHDVNIHVN